MSGSPASFDGGASERHIRFVDETANGDVVLMRFKDPASRYAVLRQDPPRRVGETTSEAADDTLEVLLLLLPETKPDVSKWIDEGDRQDATAPVYLKYRGVELWWKPGRAALQCDAEQVELLLPALVEFAHYEGELRRIEQEIAGAWADVEEDNRLAFEVSSADLRRSQVVGGRMERTLRRRMRLARIEPHLYVPDAKLPAAGRKLGEELRERAGIEARAEIVDGQLEVFEHIYEMGSQRMGEYRASRQGNIVEWIIVVLLAAEALLMLLQTLRRLPG